MTDATRASETGTDPAVHHANQLDTGNLSAIPEFVRGFGLGALGERMRIELIEATHERVVGRMPVEGNTQPYGLLHGGASCVLAEQLGSIAANIHGGEDHIAMGVEINASHHRAITAGTVTGVATPLHLGRTQTTHQIEISDEAGRRICTARLTCVLRRRTPSDGEA